METDQGLRKEGHRVREIVVFRDRNRIGRVFRLVPVAISGSSVEVILRGRRSNRLRMPARVRCRVLEAVVVTAGRWVI